MFLVVTSTMMLASTGSKPQTNDYDNARLYITIITCPRNPDGKTLRLGRKHISATALRSAVVILTSFPSASTSNIPPLGSLMLKSRHKFRK